VWDVDVWGGGGFLFLWLGLGRVGVGMGWWLLLLGAHGSGIWDMGSYVGMIIGSNNLEGFILDSFSVRVFC